MSVSGKVTRAQEKRRDMAKINEAGDVENTAALKTVLPNSVNADGAQVCGEDSGIVLMVSWNLVYANTPRFFFSSSHIYFFIHPTHPTNIPVVSRY